MTPRRSPLRFPAVRPSRIVVGFGVVLIALLLGLTATVLIQRRSDDLDESRRETANLAFALAEETSRSFEGVDLVVRRVVEQIRTAGIDTPAAYKARLGGEAVHRMLRDRLAGLPQLDAVTLVGADGTLVNFSRDWPVPPVNLADRDYFRALKDHPSLEPFVSEPVQNRGTGSWTIYLARRVSAPDGSFVGLVLGAMTLHYFDQFYSHLALEADSSIALFRRDGTLLVRYPEVEGAVGHSLGRTPILGPLETQSTVTEIVRSELDGVDRIISGRALADFPLAVTFAQSKPAILAAWRVQAVSVSVGVLLAALGLIAFIAVLVRALKRRERSEAALAVSEKRYIEKSIMLEATLEHMSQGIMMIRRDRRVPVYNRRAVEFLGLPPEMMHENVSFDEIVAHQRRSGEFGRGDAPVEDETRRIIGSGMLLDVPHSYERERPNGTILEISSVPLPDGGVVRTYTDITTFRHNEAALRQARDAANAAARVKSDFLAMMSHEIRSPMSGVLGFAELLRATELDKEQREMVELIQSSANNLLGVINDVLDFSKLEAGAVAIAPEPVMLKSFLSPRLEPLLLAARQKGLSLLVEIAPDLPDCVLVDPLRLWQILLNLLSNAVKFTEKGTIRLEVSAPPNVEGPRRLRFRVEDTGIGMDQAVLDRLFQPFMQADASTTKRFGGTGLGLSIARRLAALMGGDLVADSVPDKGSRFDLVVPLADAAPPAITGDGADQITDFRAAGPFRVLVVEDQATNRFLIQRQLQQLGIDADIAEDGRAGFEAYGKRPYALLLTDCHMPEMDGIELTARIRAREAGGARMPIIGLTADITPEITQRCRAAGMDEVLTKPTRLGRLQEVLRLHLLAATADPARAAPETGDADFDPSVFEELFSDAEQEGFDWLDQYLAAAGAMLEGIASSLAAREVEALTGTVHRLAGASLAVGAGRLGQLCRRVERSAKPDRLSEAAALLAEMRLALRQTADAIGRFKSRRGRAWAAS